MRHPLFIKSASAGSKAISCLLVLPLLMLGQQPAQKSVQSQVQASTGIATFSATAQLVVEEVSVKDKNGKAIEGLKQEDFVVTEDNKPQVIKFFDYEKLEDAVEADPALQQARIPDPVPLAKLTHTQIAPEPTGKVLYKDHRLLAIYFDMTSMQILDQLHALDAATSFIKKQMSKSDMMAIMQYNGN